MNSQRVAQGSGGLLYAVCFNSMQCTTFDIRHSSSCLSVLSTSVDDFLHKFTEPLIGLWTSRIIWGFFRLSKSKNALNIHTNTNIKRVGCLIHYIHRWFTKFILYSVQGVNNVKYSFGNFIEVSLIVALFMLTFIVSHYTVASITVLQTNSRNILYMSIF